MNKHTKKDNKAQNFTKLNLTQQCSGILHISIQKLAILHYTFSPFHLFWSRFHTHTQLLRKKQKLVLLEQQPKNMEIEWFMYEYKIFRSESPEQRTRKTQCDDMMTIYTTQANN